MPVEIRELIIKTEVMSAEQQQHTSIGQKELAEMKTHILKTCKRMILEQTKKTSFKR